MSRRLITPPEPAPPTVHEIIDALESARELLGSCGQLAKGHAFIWAGNGLCFCTVGAITAASRTKAIRDVTTLLWQAKSYVGLVAA